MIFTRQYMFVIKQLTDREIKRKYSRSYLGVLWSVLNPLLSMFVLSLIFSQLFKRSIENYPIYYLTGYILWQMFTGATNSAMTAISDNKGLLIKVKFPMELFIITRVFGAIINLGYSLVAYLVMLLLFDIKLKWTILMAPIIIFFLVLFSLGISYILCTVYVFFGDIQYLYSVGLTLWMYCSGIFYPVEQLKGFIYKVIVNNPIYIYINCLRKSVMYAKLITFNDFLGMAIWGVSIYILGHMVFLHNKNKIIQKI